MPRGSKPGERRGGRQRATPNRRTVLTNRILAVAADNPASTPNELVFNARASQKTDSCVGRSLSPALLQSLLRGRVLSTGNYE